MVAPVPPPAPFVVGMARSGTTLLRLMLDAHPQVAVPPETWFVPHVIRAFAEAPRPPSAAGAVALMQEHSSWEDFGLSPEAVVDEIGSAAQLDVATALRGFYRAYARGQGKPRWGDKSPPYVMEMEAIEAVLPEARFIHLIRDGRDVVLSADGIPWAPEAIDEVARRWRRCIRRARRQALRLRHYVEVRYEQLVLEPQATLEGVCDFLDLDWDPGMLGYHRRAAQRMARENQRAFEPVRGAGAVPADVRRAAHALTDEPPRADRVARWRREMNPADVAAVEEVAGDVLEALGYPTGASGDGFKFPA